MEHIYKYVNIYIYLYISKGPLFGPIGNPQFAKRIDVTKL